MGGIARTYPARTSSPCEARNAPPEKVCRNFSFRSLFASSAPTPACRPYACIAGGDAERITAGG
ncbi:Protein of unknown function [Pyronema omphalodes CBS 100304]|uniref:Uncharacterized protein n=1 Tax=Pyronema omphalodes (strain CBS 100304) TaxID=1076935 RepID=U4KZC8_PYROM|nr:Protein of unknown function [Pyronema omphalodes CBS 100304]